VSYERNVSMEIFGEITEVGIIEELAVQMEDYVRPDYDEGTFTFDEAVEYIIAAIKDGQAINVYQRDTNSDLGNLTAVCQSRGLSYRFHSERYDSEAAYVRTWAPWFTEERRPDVLDDFRAAVPIDHLRKLLKLPDPGYELEAEIRRADSDMLEDMPRKVTAPRDVIEDAADLLGDATPTP